MIADILTVIWKENMSFSRLQGSVAKLLLPLIWSPFLAIVLPWVIGPNWVTSFSPMFLAVLTPIVFVGLTIPDSFAGERERNTLSTLLASRLPDRAILIGKALPLIIVGWVFSLIMLAIALLVVNIVHGEGELLWYSPIVASATIAVSLLLAIFTAVLGVLISLRMGRVQEAAQVLVGALILPPAALGLVVFVFFRDRIAEVMGSISPGGALLVFATILLVAIVGLSAAAMASFKRSKLILAK